MTSVGTLGRCPSLLLIFAFLHLFYCIGSCSIGGYWVSDFLCEETYGAEPLQCMLLVKSVF